MTTFIWIVVLLMFTTQLDASGDMCPIGCNCTGDKEKTVFCGSGVKFDGSNIPSFPAAVTKLVLTGVPLNSLTDSAFHDADRLKDLMLDNCKIKSISSSAFSGLNSLQYLNLNENDLSEDTFKANLTLSKLEILLLSRNKFSQIPAVLQNFAPNLIRLYIHNNHLASYNMGSFMSDLSKLELLDLGDNPVTQINNSDFTALKNLNITSLDLSSPTIMSVSSEALQYFPQLSYLQLGGNSLTGYNLSIPLQSLGNVSLKLHHLAFSNMTLTHIPKDMFSTLKNINTLNLTKNHIRYIDKDAFTHMSKLSELYLQQNEIESTESVSSLHSLVTLDMSHNEIKENKAFDMNKNKLRTLDLSYNSITNIPASWLTNQNKIKLIKLCHNRITSISVAAFHNVTVDTLDLSDNHIDTGHRFGNILVHKLFLSRNRILYLTKDMFYLMYQSLDELDLSDNNIFHIHDNQLELFYTLDKLNLSHNHIGEALSGGKLLNLFNSLSHLRELDLSHNGIKKLPSKQFSHLPMLRKLFLNGNRIEAIGSGHLESLHYLQSLDLSNNNFKSIDRVSIARLILLTTLNASKNPFHCGCELEEFLTWVNYTQVDVVGLKDKTKYQCVFPPDFYKVHVLDYKAPHGSCIFHRRRPGINGPVVGITVGVVALGIIVLVLVLYFGKVCSKLKSFQYNWQIRYKEVNDGETQVII